MKDRVDLSKQIHCLLVNRGNSKLFHNWAIDITSFGTHLQRTG